MNDTLRKLAKDLEEGGEHEEAQELHKLIKEEPAKEVHTLTVTISGASEEELLESLHKTLTEIADKLDEGGKVKEADLVDGLLTKVAGTQAFEPYYVSGSTLGLQDAATFVVSEIRSLQEDGVLSKSDPDAIGVLKHLSPLFHKLRDAHNAAQKGTMPPPLPKHAELTVVADKLDALGLTKEADLLDETIKHLAAKEKDLYDSKKNNEETFKHNKPKKQTEIKHHNPDYQETKDKGLSSRYCPEHIGVMLARVGDRQYECSLDGKRFNYDDLGSVANQTPSSSNVAIPSRLFDPREDVVNKVH